MIEKDFREPLYDGEHSRESEDVQDTSTASIDLQKLFDMMPNRRYVYIIQKLMIEDVEPERLAEEMNITVDNLYNIKRRAMVQLSRVALNDIKEYEK